MGEGMIQKISSNMIPGWEVGCDNLKNKIMFRYIDLDVLSQAVSLMADPSCVNQTFRYYPGLLFFSNKFHRLQKISPT